MKKPLSNGDRLCCGGLNQRVRYTRRIIEKGGPEWTKDHYLGEQPQVLMDSTRHLPPVGAFSVSGLHGREENLDERHTEPSNMVFFKCCLCGVTIVQRFQVGTRPLSRFIFI